MLALFRHYPLLQEKLAHVSLGEFPTPVEEVPRLGQALDVPRLYFKRDDLSGRLYGGNKLRALEFLLGDAQKRGRKRVLALGFPASTQALAQAIYAPRVGLKSMAVLFPQPTSEQGRRHLLLYRTLGAEIHAGPPLYALIRHWLKDGRFPSPLHASSPLGVVGYVSAGLELGEQIENGSVPEPDRVYVAVATMGTAVGLALGLQAGGLRTQVVGIHLGSRFASPSRMANLFRRANDLLHGLDPTFPQIEVSETDFPLRYGYGDHGKRLLTEAGAREMARVREFADLQLDEMFTANAFAALADDAAEGALSDKVVLWWNTYNSRDFPNQIASADPSRLPRRFQHYWK